MSWLNYVLGLLKAYPELSSILFGSILSAAIVAAADIVYFPKEWSFRKCQQIALALNVVIGTIASYGLWRFLDKADSRWFSLWVSAVAVAGSPGLLFVLSKALSAWKPNWNLSFGLLSNREKPE